MEKTKGAETDGKAVVHIAHKMPGIWGANDFDCVTILTDDKVSR